MIAIQGLRLDSISITLEDTEDKVTGYYSLMSNQGKVLAKQSFNDYSGVKITFSAETLKALNSFLVGAKKDAEVTLGLFEEGGK